MHPNHWLFLLSIFLIKSAKAEILPVSIYYESLCPDCIRFVTTQFYPAFESLKEYLDVDLIPFGKATAFNVSGHWKFVCQHGPRECYGNKVHSCVLAHNSIASSADFVNCAMSSDDPSANSFLEACAEASGISWNDVENCLTSGEGDDLLAQNGVKTHLVTPPISYIPTIIFNKIYDKRKQHEAEIHFLKVACQLLKNVPDVCKNLDIFVRIVI